MRLSIPTDRRGTARPPFLFLPHRSVTSRQGRFFFPRGGCPPPNETIIQTLFPFQMAMIPPVSISIALSSSFLIENNGGQRHYLSIFSFSPNGKISVSRSPTPRPKLRSLHSFFFLPFSLSFFLGCTWCPPSDHHPPPFFSTSSVKMATSLFSFPLRTDDRSLNTEERFDFFPREHMTFLPLFSRGRIRVESNDSPLD